MLDLVVLPSATTKTARSIKCNDIRPASSSPSVAETLQGPANLSNGNCASVFTNSSFSSGLPPTLPEAPFSRRQNSSQRRQPSLTISSNRHHHPNSNNDVSRAQSGSTVHSSASLSGSVPTNAEQRELFSTSPPLSRPALATVDVAAAAGPSQTARQETGSLNSQSELLQSHKDKLVLSTKATPVISAVTTTTTSTVSRLSPPALAVLAEVLPPSSTADDSKGGLKRSTTPMSVDTVPVLNHTAFTAVTAVTAAQTTSTTTQSSPPSRSQASAGCGAVESNWVDYDMYLRLSAALVPQRALQDRLVQMCCATTRTESTEEHRVFVCLDNVLTFLLHGNSTFSPPASAAAQSSTNSPLVSLPCGSVDAERACFPLFCLLGAKMCTLAEHNHTIRSIHTPTPPMALSAALNPRRESQNTATSRKLRGEGRLQVLLLFSEQLMSAFPEFPTDLLYTTSPSGTTVSAPPSEAMVFWRNWQATPREVRQGVSYDALWSVITLRRFAVLLQRWAVSPAAAIQRLRLAATSESLHPPQAAAAAVPRQLLLPTADSNSCLSIQTPQCGLDGEVAVAADNVFATVEPRNEVSAPAATTSKTPSPKRTKSHLPYPPSACPLPPQSSIEMRNDLSTTTTITTDTAVSGSTWDCGSSSARAAAVLNRGDFTPATAAAVRSRRTRHEAAPLAPIDTDRPDELLTQDAGAGEGSGHPYNPSVTTDMKTARDGGSDGERALYGQLHRYDVPSPPKVSVSAMIAAGGMSDGAAVFLRTFARNGGVMPCAVYGSGSSCEAWCAKKGTSPLCVPPPPPKFQLQPQPPQQRHLRKKTPTPLSTRTKYCRYNDVFTPLPPRPTTADVPHRPLRMPKGASDSALHPYNVASSSSPPPSHSTLKHHKSHRHSRSSTRHHRNDDEEEAAHAHHGEGSGAPQRERTSNVADKETEVDKAGPALSSGAQTDSGSRAYSARKRTEQVNAYVQSLLTAAAARNNGEGAAGAVASVFRNDTATLPSGTGTESNGAAALPRSPPGGDLHTHSCCSNTSANANSLNGGRPMKALDSGSVGGASAHSNATPETLPVNTRGSQRVSTGVQYVPAPPPPQAASQSRRSNPHFSILPSWESSMMSQSGSIWEATPAGDKETPLTPPPSADADGALLLFHSSRSAPAEPSRVEGWERRDGMTAAAFLEGEALIPSITSSQSQFTTSPPSHTVSAQPQSPREVLACPPQGCSTTVSNTAVEGRSSATPHACLPNSSALFMPTVEMTQTLDDVNTSDKAVLLVSHTPEHGVVVRSLKLTPVTSARITGRSVSGETMPTEVVVERTVQNVKATPSGLPDAPASPGKNAHEDVVSMQAMVLVGTSQGSGGVLVEGVAPQPAAGLQFANAAQLSSLESTTVDQRSSEKGSLTMSSLIPAASQTSGKRLVPFKEKAAAGAELDPLHAPPRLGIAAQLRSLIAPVVQAVGRGYLVRRDLGLEASLHKAHVRHTRSEKGAPTSSVTSPSTSPHSIPNTPGPNAATTVFHAAQHEQPLPTIAVVPASAGNRDAAAVIPGADTAITVPPAGPSLLMLSTTEPKATRKVHPPPLTAFTAPESPATLRSPVMHGSLPTSGASASVNVAEVKANELSCPGAVKSNSLKGAHSANDRGLNRSSSQSSGTSSQHPSTVSPTQRLFAIYGVLGNSALENSSSSWIPQSSGINVGNSGACATSYEENGVLESKPPRSLRAGEQSLDALRYSSLYVPWAKDGAKGAHDCMTSTHTLPPPKDENPFHGCGEEEGSASQRVKRKDGSHFMTSIVVPSTKEGVDRQSSLPPSLMKPIMIPSCDCLAEEASSSVLRESAEDWLNLLHNHLSANGSCTVVFLGQTPNGPAGGNVVSSLQDPPGSRNQTGSGRRRYSSSLNETWAVNSARRMLRLQRIGRGYLARLQLARRYRDDREEESLDALLKSVMQSCPPFSLPPSATAVTTATPTGAATANEEGAEEQTVKSTAKSGSAEIGDKREAGESNTHPVDVVTRLSSEVPSGAASPQAPAGPTAAHGTLAAPQSPPPPVVRLGANSTLLSSSDYARLSPLAVFLGHPLSPFQMPSTHSSGSAFVADSNNEHASLVASSASASKSGNGVPSTGAAGAASASAVVDSASNCAREDSPFVTPDNSRYLIPPVLLSPSAQHTAQRSSPAVEFPRSNSLSLSKEVLPAGTGSGGGAMTIIATAIGSALLNRHTAADGGVGGVEPPSLPPSASRRRGMTSPPSVRVSFSRDSYSSMLRHSGSEFSVAVAANTLGACVGAVTPASSVVSAEMPCGSKSPRMKVVEGINGLVIACRSPPPGEADTVLAASYSSSGAAASPVPASTAVVEEPMNDNADSGPSTNAVQGEVVEVREAEGEAEAGESVELIPCWKAASAAAGASVSPLEGSLFAASGRSGRSMISANSLPFEFSTTAHAISAMSQGELMLSGRTVEGMTPAQWALDAVEVVDSASHFDDGESASEDNDDSRGSGSDSDEEAQEGDNSSDDEDANEADAFKKDITHVEEAGVEPACFGAAADLLRGEGTHMSKDGALSLLQRVGRGYLCRRHEHFLFLVSISFAEVALLQRVAVAFLTRRKLGLEYRVNHMVKEEMEYWELRNQAAIKLHAVVRGFIARQRVKQLQRKLFTRIELRTALELPDPDE